MRTARHRAPGRLAEAWCLLRVLSGEFGPGPQGHVVMRYAMAQLALLAERDGKR